MNVVYNSEHYHVVEYPATEGYELINKDAGRAAFISGGVAEAFRATMNDMIASNPSLEVVDEFLGGFDDLMMQPMIYH